MIDRDYCVTMARYNRWQNAQLETLLGALGSAELTQDRGAFFGSILGTVNHIFWGDMMWMSRFDGGASPEQPASESAQVFPTLAAWAAERFRLDGRIRQWALGIHAVDLAGHLTWYSGSAGREVTAPVSQLVVHFFNHQTHHRGQVHAMLTATGSKAPVSDLFLIPDEK